MKNLDKIPTDESRETPRREAPSPMQAAWAGTLDAAPTLAMVAPFGLLAGAVSAEAGLDLAQTVALSALVFAGASQLASIELLRAGAPVLVILATGLAINLRFTMYAAALAPWLRGGARWPRIAASYLLVDGQFALATAWFRKIRGADVAARLAYLIGGGLLAWTVWQIATVVGFFVGAAIPPSWSLDFAAPIAFLGLAMPLLRDKPSWVAALVGGALATALKDLPFNFGVLIASVAAIGAALLAERALPTPSQGIEPREAGE